MSDYELVTTVLSSRYEQVNGYDFYRDIFPNNEITGELNTNFSKPNAIYLYKDIDTGKMKRSITRANREPRRAFRKSKNGFREPKRRNKYKYI